MAKILSLRWGSAASNLAFDYIATSQVNEPESYGQTKVTRSEPFRNKRLKLNLDPQRPTWHFRNHFQASLPAASKRSQARRAAGWLPTALSLSHSCDRSHCTIITCIRQLQPTMSTTTTTNVITECTSCISHSEARVIDFCTRALKKSSVLVHGHNLTSFLKNSLYFD